MQRPAPAILPPDADPDLVREYVSECRELIEAAEAALLELEADPGTGEAIHTLFRAFHTIKGTSGFLGLAWIQELAHGAENLLEEVRAGRLAMTGRLADLVLKSCDLLGVLIDQVAAARPGARLAVPEAYPTLLAHLGNPNDPAHAGDPVPRLGDLLVAHGKTSRGDLEATLRVDPDAPTGEALVRAGKVSRSDVAEALRRQAEIRRRAAEATVRVSTVRLDQLLDLVGELGIAHSMLAADPRHPATEVSPLARQVTQAGKLVRGLQDLTMALRMVPLRATFQRVARLTRDLGRSSGKRLQLETDGEATELDRTMIEGLSGALTHLVRNAIDHGIEPPDERRAAGKPPAGRITLTARQTAGQVQVTVADDGRGLDPERIRAAAASRGQPVPEGPLSTEQLGALICEPGLSTARRLTEVSGRGVGMDAVRQAVVALQGRLAVASRPGAGTAITLHLPLTMATAEAMLVRVGSERYLLPTHALRESWRPAAEELPLSIAGRELVRWRDQSLPLIRLAEHFGIRGATADPREGLLIVLEATRRRAALLVDALLGQQRVVLKPLGPRLGRVPEIAGATILGDGRVGLLLDAPGLLDIASAALPAA